MNTTLIFVGGALSLLWGVSHLVPTANVVRDFGNITQDNKRIITMEWINEGATLIFLGALVVVVTLVDPTADMSLLVYLMVAIMLFVLAGISLFTGFRINFLPFRLCPFIFSGSAILILIGAYM